MGNAADCRKALNLDDPIPRRSIFHSELFKEKDEEELIKKVEKNMEKDGDNK